MIEFREREEFSRELSRLLKKWPSIREDLHILRKVLSVCPRGFEPGTVRMAGFKADAEIFKVKHFRCRSMKGKGARSGIRIVYAFLPEKNRIEFVQIYYKEKDDSDCDRARIREYYGRAVVST